ncbi:MAG: matrixin family metalloprotease [Vulcanimicrobiota bacterium]
MKFCWLLPWLWLSAPALARPLPKPQARILHLSSPVISARAHADWTFQIPPPDPPPPPDRYEVLRIGSRPCHLPLERTPWRLEVGDGRYWPILERAMQVWNVGVQPLGMSYLFLPADPQNPPDIVLRWYDPQLPRDKAAATWWSTGLDVARVLGISLDGNFRVPEGNMTQILAHELGHVLGLGESQQPGDLMYYRTSTRPLSMQEVQLSPRDFQALRWLYAQEYYTPIRSPRD